MACAPPIVFLSLQDNLPHREVSWEQGAADFSKPCYWSQLQGRSGPSAGLLSPTGSISQLVASGAFLKSQVPAPCGLCRSHLSWPVGYRSAPAPWLVLSVPLFPSLWGCVSELEDIWGY